MNGQKPGSLRLIATPIGNLGDLSLRTRETLESCTLLACEDTRVTGRLLAHLSLSIQMVSYREENERTKTGELIDAIEQGAQVGLVSDAGFPGISDPGLRLVRECHARSIRVIPIPGPNAAITALAASGLPTHQFTFLGFLPKKSVAVRKLFEQWKDCEGSLVFYESKYKIEKTLILLSEVYGEDRFVSLARELTKVHETILSGSLSDVAARFQSGSSKGEFTVVVAPQGYSIVRQT